MVCPPPIVFSCILCHSLPCSQCVLRHFGSICGAALAAVNSSGVQQADADPGEIPQGGTCEFLGAVVLPLARVMACGRTVPAVLSAMLRAEQAVIAGSGQAKLKAGKKGEACLVATAFLLRHCHCRKRAQQAHVPSYKCGTGRTLSMT